MKGMKNFQLNRNRKTWWVIVTSLCLICIFTWFGTRPQNVLVDWLLMMIFGFPFLASTCFEKTGVKFEVLAFVFGFLNLVIIGLLITGRYRIFTKAIFITIAITINITSFFIYLYSKS